MLLGPHNLGQREVIGFQPKENTMAKYPDVTAGQTEACINRIGGWPDFLRFIGGEGRVVFETLPTAIEPLKEKIKEVIVYLRMLFTFKLGARQRKDTHATTARRVFGHYLDSKFEKHGIVFSGVAPDVEITAEELIHDGKFTDFLGITALELEKRRLLGSQFLAICRHNADKLRDQVHANFFVLTRNDEVVAEDLSNVFVAIVLVYEVGKLHALLYHVSYGSVWCRKDRHRFFSPKLIT